MNNYEINPDVAKPSINVDAEYSKIATECISEIIDGIAQIRQILQSFNKRSKRYERCRAHLVEMAENANILDKLYSHLCQRNPNLTPAG